MGPELGNGAVSSPECEDGAVETVAVPLGRRVEIVGDLLLPPEPTASSRAACGDIAQRLEEWEGPGFLVLCGRLVAPGCGEESGRAGVLHGHPELAEALRAFAARPDSRVVVVTTPAERDPALAEALEKCGVAVRSGVDLVCDTGAGTRTVLVRAGSLRPEATPPTDSNSTEDRPWLAGMERLEDPRLARRFVTSRLLYRRLRRFLWAPPLVLAAIALLLRVDFVINGLGRVFRSDRQQDALNRAYAATWFSRAVVTVIIAILLLAVLALVVALTSRGIWRALGGEGLPVPWARGPSGARPVAHALLEVDGADALDFSREATESGASGVVVGGALVPELTHLDVGFFACPGATSEVVREHRGRLGLPPTFLHHRQESTLEIETGADLHVRLNLAEADLPMATLGERLVTADSVVKGRSKAAELHPELAAGWPSGASWPPAPEVAADRIRVRRIRRVAAVSLFVAGVVTLLSSVIAPLRAHLHLVAQYLPLSVVQAAGALTAIAGIGMIMLSRGILKGQRRSWVVAIVLLATSLGLHLLHDAGIITLLVSAAVLVLLVVQRERFRAETERATLVTALVILAAGGVVATLGGFVAVEVAGRVHHHELPGWPQVLLGSAERLVGVRSIQFPSHIDRFVSISLLAVGLSLIVVALYLLTRPVVDRRLSAGRAAMGRRAAELRARDIVRRHGTGTLDYFALRDDKQWFFHRDSLVAYAVLGGVCLVSPDPIGPFSERAHVWDSFRNFVDRNGWGLGLMGAGEEWLPTYQSSGMHFIYIGDEAVVDPRTFSLEGGKMKGLRQAVNRVARYGYTVRFLDPAHLDAADAAGLAELVGMNRRGEHERGFSMTLGRLCDPRDGDLLLTLVADPDGIPVAMCQFVPSPAISGYSLDLMRRDPGDHPNGLLDFALCSTITHLKERGMKGLSLNFAAMRSILEGESGDGMTQRVERWALKRLSGALQIESLWKFNAKYEPRWIPRYIVFDSAEQFVPVAVQIMRAESLTEIPVIGRLLATRATKKSSALLDESLAEMGHRNGQAGGVDGTGETEGAAPAETAARETETAERSA
ncbi:MAG TPA: phosphatidylglycerol lysyltransferase domain-containing protein [Acidimicrobiales bacterium]|nr:phosphatidylglycerol lysyltransferase domain-containing protein [Acidimicrobiales bacterium]